MGPGTPRTLCATALLALLLLAPAGCGGDDSAEFTRDNYGELSANADAYDGAGVDIVGRVTVVERVDEGLFFHMFADPAADDWPTIVAVPEPEPGLALAEGDFVQVVGVVRPGLELPESMSGFVEEPIVVASGVTPSAPPSG